MFTYAYLLCLGVCVFVYVFFFIVLFFCGGGMHMYVCVHGNIIHDYQKNSWNNSDSSWNRICTG